MWTRWLLPVAALFLLTVPCHALGDYPKLEFYVTDQVGILLEQEIYDIEDVPAEVYSRTGAEMAVLIVNTTQPDGIDLFAVKTFEKTGLGQKGKDDGVLILISYSENEWRVEIGYGLEGILPDSRVGRIAREHLVPYLNQSMYYEGIYNFTLTLGQIIVDEYDGKPPEKKDPWYPIPCLPLLWWQLLILIAIVVVLMVVTKGRGLFWILWILSFGRFRGGGGGGGFGGGRSGGGGASGRF